MTDENTEDSPHGNDADSKPYIRRTARSKHSEVEVVVEGAEGESIEDIEEIADKHFEDTKEGQKEMRKRDKDGSSKSYK